jgi:hypothetical protein
MREGLIEIKELIKEGQAVDERRLDRRHRQDKIARLQREAAEAFGRKHGWKIASRCFTLQQLAGRRKDRRSWRPGKFSITAHATFYRDVQGRPAAIAAHLYEWPESGPEIEVACEALGLHYEAPADSTSWYFPGVTQLIIYTRLEPPRRGQLNLPFAPAGLCVS